MVSYKKLIAIFAYSLALFIGGYTVNEHYHGYKDNQRKELEELVDKSMRNIESGISKSFESMQLELKDRKVEVLEVEVPKIIEKPIYKNVCIDQQGVDVLYKFKMDSKTIIQGDTK